MISPTGPALLFPPRGVESRPGRFSTSSPLIRVSGPTGILEPAAKALDAAGIKLVTDNIVSLSARCGPPDRGLIDKATAAWLRLLDQAGPERFPQAFCIVINEKGFALQAGGPAGLLYGLLHLAEAWDGGLDCGSIADWPEIVSRCVLLDI